MIRNWRLLLAAALLACCGAAGPAHAQSFPSRPITIVVPYPAGGVTDNLVRLLAERMKNSLGQSIVIENIGGGGGTIGVDRVSRAAPDGYTLVLGNSEKHGVRAGHHGDLLQCADRFRAGGAVAELSVPLGDDQRRAGERSCEA